jgi:hypothetical protein
MTLAGRGICMPGTQACLGIDGKGRMRLVWGSCTGEVSPAAEICGDDDRSRTATAATSRARPAAAALRPAVLAPSDADAACHGRHAPVRRWNRHPVRSDDDPPHADRRDLQRGRRQLRRHRRQRRARRRLADSVVLPVRELARAGLGICRNGTQTCSSWCLSAPAWARSVPRPRSATASTTTATAERQRRPRVRRQ